MNKITVFKFLIEYLEKSSIGYCLLGASDQYPNGSGDIDFAVTRDAFKKLDGCLQDFCSRHQYLVVQKLQHESTACSYVLSCFNEAGNGVFLCRN